MFGSMFHHVDLLNKTMDASWLKNEVHAQNVANQDTPNYNAKYVEFDTQFKRALLELDKGEFAGKKTRAKHIDIGARDIDPLEVNPFIAEDTVSTMRMDGNNVDIDAEMNEVAKNTIYYNSLANKVTSELRRLRSAIVSGG